MSNTTFPTLTTPGCGVDEHDDACLCDVHVTTPAPILHGIDFLDFWHCRYIAERLDYNGPADGPTATIEYLGQVIDVYDQLEQVRAMSAAVGNTDKRTMTANRKLVVQMLRDGISILDTPTLMGSITGDDWSLPFIAQALTSGRTSQLWRWNEDTWRTVETALVSADRSAAQLGAELGITRQLVSRLAKWYGVSLPQDNLGRHAPGAAERRTLLTAMVKENPNITTPEAYTRLVNAGHDVRVQAVRTMLNRVKKQAA